MKQKTLATCHFTRRDIVKKLHVFLISNTFINHARLKLVKNKANAKQHPKAELLLFKNYSHSSSTLSSKNNGI